MPHICVLVHAAITKGEGGFGMNIDDDGFVLSYTGEAGSAEASGVVLNSQIVSVNAFGVTHKDQIVTQLKKVNHPGSLWT